MNEQALIVDLYELTMAAGYFEQNYNPTVTFELFIRDLPVQRNYLISAGQAQVVDYLTQLHFTTQQVEYLRALPNFRHISAGFFDYLRDFRFTGNLYGLPEGSVTFANEPILQVQAPLIQAQIVETFLLASINFQTMVASKAARVVYAATLDGKERGVMEFGSRRAHGPQASELAARAAYLAGFIGTSNMLAGYKYNIPVLGTTAHSWTMAFENERQAFQNYYDIFKDEAVFLIDTYDTVQGLENAMRVAPRFKAVRIDSGDLAAEAVKIRRLLNENHHQEVQIILSSDLNEYKISDLVKRGIPVDSFGVGTQVVTSFDAPTLQGVYKMVEIKEKGVTEYRAKFSRNKATLPGRKQVWRFFDSDGKMLYDLIALANENFAPAGKALSTELIINGRPVVGKKPLKLIRSQVKKNLKTLPNALFALAQKLPYKIEYSKQLQTILKSLREKVNNGNGVH